MDEEVRIGLNMRRTEKQKGLEEIASGKSIIKRFGDIFNPLRSARLLASNVSSERNPRLARILYGFGLANPFIVIVSGIGMVWAGGYGIKEGIEKYLY